MFSIAFDYKTCLVVLVNFSVFARLGKKDIGTDVKTDFKSKLGELNKLNQLLYGRTYSVVKPRMMKPSVVILRVVKPE